MVTVAAEREAIEETRCFAIEMVSEPAVLAMPELPEDELLRARANQFIRSIGSYAMSQSIEMGNQEPGYNDSLLIAIKKGAEGDETARKMVEANVGSDFSERVIKAGEVTKYFLQKNEDDELMQFGQPYTSVYANALSYTPNDSKLRPRTEAETRNAERITYHAKNGLLDDYYMVVFSLCPEDMSDEELDGVGYFSDTKTMAVQVTTLEDGAVSIESAFLAGVKNETTSRHDFDAVVGFAAEYGFDYRGMSSSEIIDTPLLIPKTFMQNGVIDLVEVLDDIAGGMFFGEEKPRQDYAQFRSFCDVRRKSYAEDIQEVTKQLLAEADTINCPYMAVQRLNKLCGAQMVKRAVKDKTIDATVFGPEAAGYIEQARQYYEAGNEKAASNIEAQALQTEQSRSCPSGVSRRSEVDARTFEASTNENNPKAGEDKYGSLTFKCPKGHTNRRPRNKLIPNCRVCGTSVRC